MRVKLRENYKTTEPLLSLYRTVHKMSLSLLVGKKQDFNDGKYLHMSWKTLLMYSEAEIQSCTPPVTFPDQVCLC